MGIIQDREKPKKLIVLAGPTASGKTALAADLIKEYPLKIISADSRQVYRGLDIGTGKDKTVPQKLIDVVDPPLNTDNDTIFSAAEFRKLGEEATEEIWSKNQIPLVVGGTGYYIEALVFEQPTNITAPNKSLREELNQLSNQQLWVRINSIDPVTSASIDRHNRRRLIRAAEVVSITDKPIAPAIRRERPDLLVTWYVVDIYREELYARIDRRVDDRIKAGMIEEVEDLLKSGVPSDWLLSLGLEYYWITRLIKKEISQSEMIERLKFAIHAYARRQLTFFRRWPDAQWLYPDKIKQAIANSTDFK